MTHKSELVSDWAKKLQAEFINVGLSELYVSTCTIAEKWVQWNYLRLTVPLRKSGTVLPPIIFCYSYSCQRILNLLSYQYHIVSEDLHVAAGKVGKDFVT